MKKIKVILSALLMAAAISFTACSNASSGSDSDKKDTPAKTETPDSTKPDSGSGSGSGSGSQTKKYIGSKAPSEAKEVGDIVFNDGSAAPSKNVKRLTDAQKKAAVAVIFYTGKDLNDENDTTTVKTLGLGLKLNKNGNDWSKSVAYGVNYSTIVTNLENFDTNWSLPTRAEFSKLYETGFGDNKIFDIENILDILGGNKFEDSSYWTKSEADESSAYIFDFGKGSQESKSMDETYYTCVIRDFTTYTITPQSTEQVIITTDKESATAGEKVTLSYTPAAPDDYEITFNEFIVMNGSNPVQVTNNSFIMPVGNVKVSADIDYEDLYSITIISSEGGSVAANKTKGIKEGENITLTVTTDSAEDKLISLIKNGTPLTITDNKASFNMPTENVTISAVFGNLNYFGNKKPAAAKEVGDIVFNDGSAMPYSIYSMLSSEEQDLRKTNAIALIFYKGTGLNNGNDTTTTRTLGLGLKIIEERWCTLDAKAHSINIETIQCKYSDADGKYTFTGDKNGSDNLEQISAYLKAINKTDDTGTAEKYPAFSFAKNYSTKVTNLGDYDTGWYLPSIAELHEIYVNGIGTKKVFDIDAVLKDITGESVLLDNSGYSFWSSSQCAPDQQEDNDLYKKACRIKFSDANQQEVCFCGDKDGWIWIYTCCIREF